MPRLILLRIPIAPPACSVSRCWYSSASGLVYRAAGADVERAESLRVGEVVRRKPKLDALLGRRSWPPLKWACLLGEMGVGAAGGDGGGGDGERTRPRLGPRDCGDDWGRLLGPAGGMGAMIADARLLILLRAGDSSASSTSSSPARKASSSSSSFSSPDGEYSKTASHSQCAPLNECMNVRLSH